LAVESGADMVELDVRMTRDFFLVVHHDQNIRRTTNGSGFIWDLTLEELRTLDAGSWFSPRFKGERIPTVRQVMDILPPHVGLNMEVKTDGDPRKRIALAEACILAIMEKRFEQRILVSSFDHRFLRRVHSLLPEIATGALYLPVRDMRRKPSMLARTIGTTTFICSRAQLRTRFVEDAHKHGIRIACYSINTLQHLKQMLRHDVDAIVTDFPGRIVRYLRAR
jgi:glycerophosphoryl diester phosphodiesterase